MYVPCCVYFLPLHYATYYELIEHAYEAIIYLFRLQIRLFHLQMMRPDSRLNQLFSIAMLISAWEEPYPEHSATLSYTPHCLNSYTQIATGGRKLILLYYFLWKTKHNGETLQSNWNGQVLKPFYSRLAVLHAFTRVP